jgi:hypothetical protein
MGSELSAESSEIFEQRCDMILLAFRKAPCANGLQIRGQGLER